MIGIYNIVIPKGAVFLRTFEFRHGLRLLEDLLPGSVPAATIRIEPLPIDLPANYRLRFAIKPYRGCSMVEVTTIAITPAGSDLVSIVPFTQDAKISCGSIAQTLPQDLTGQVWRGAVRKEYSDSSPLLEFDFIVNPLLGLLTIKSPATITALLQSNAVYSDLPRDLQLPDSFSPKIWQNAYYWDAEYEMPAGDVYRAFQGRVWITPEATR